MSVSDPRDRRIAELEAENARLRKELAALHADARRKLKHSAYVSRRAVLIRQGKWHPHEDAARVREHARALMQETGTGRYRFAAVAGVAAGTLSRILYDDQERVRTPVAAKILRVTAADLVRPPGYVDPAGCARRLRALAVAGWSPALLAERLREAGAEAGAASVRHLRDGERRQVKAETAQQIQELYDRLWNTPPPEETPAQKIGATRTRAFAAKQGWVPAGAWDDDEIDDPRAVPAEGWQRMPERKYRKSAELVAEAEELLSLGRVPDRRTAAERLKVTPAALDKAYSRVSRAASGEHEAAA